MKGGNHKPNNETDLYKLEKVKETESALGPLGKMQT